MHKSGLDATTGITESPALQPLSNTERTHYLALCTHLGQRPVTPPRATQSALEHLIVVHALPVTAAALVVDETASSSEEDLDSDSDDNTYYSPTDACLALTEPSGWLHQRYTNATPIVLRQAARASTPEWRQTVAEYTVLTRRDAPQIRALRQRFLADPPLPRHVAAAAHLEAEIFTFLAQRRATDLAVLFGTTTRGGAGDTEARRRAARTILRVCSPLRRRAARISLRVCPSLRRRAAQEAKVKMRDGILHSPTKTSACALATPGPLQKRLLCVGIYCDGPSWPRQWILCERRSR